MFKIGLVCVLIGMSLCSWAQDQADSLIIHPSDTLVDASSDTLITSPGDTSVVVVIDSAQHATDSILHRFDPRKALLYGAVLPGSGQVYNKKYWKVPLVIGGFALLVNAISFYNGQYKIAKNELFYTINNTVNNVPPLSPLGFSQEQLRPIVDQTRRQRDFFVVITGLVYILQMVDAHVDAHLKEFDINPKLQVRIEPRVTQDVMLGRSSGAAIIFRF